MILTSLVRGGFEGPIYPINPDADQIEGCKCYPDLKSIGETPDLVVIVVPGKAVPERDQRVRASRRRERDRHLRRLPGDRRGGPAPPGAGRAPWPASTDIRMLGPNCLGLMAPCEQAERLLRRPAAPAGAIGYFSQSGSLLAAIVDMARAKGIGFSKLISIGNKADINELDVLKALGEDAETKVIAGYLETITDGDAFIREAERISRDKPILLMKAGDTGAGGRRRLQPHRAASPERSRPTRSSSSGPGIIRCQSITAQFDYARALATQPAPARAARRRHRQRRRGRHHGRRRPRTCTGLELAKLHRGDEPEARRPPARGANTHNPIDVLGDALADRYEFALDTVLDDPNVDGVLVLLTPHAMTEPRRHGRGHRAGGAEAACGRPRTAKPILACFLGAERVREAVDDPPRRRHAQLRFARIRRRGHQGHGRLRPLARPAQAGGQALPRQPPQGREDHRPAPAPRPARIGEMESKEILEAYGFVTPSGPDRHHRRAGRQHRRADRLPGGAEDLVAGHHPQGRGRRRADWAWQRRRKSWTPST